MLIRILRKVVKASLVACQAMLVLLSLLIVAGVIARNFLNTDILIAEEMSRYLLVAISYFAIPVATQNGQLIRFSVLYDNISNNIRKLIDSVFIIIFIVFSVIIGIYVTAQVLSSYNHGVVAPTLLMTPIFIPQIVMPLGVSLLVLVLVAQLFELWSSPAETASRTDVAGHTGHGG